MTTIIVMSYTLTTSNCSFFGMIPSIYGSSFGYVSMTLALTARWADDLSFDFAPALMLRDCQLGLDHEYFVDILTPS